MGTITFAAGERPRPEWIRTHPRAWVAAVSTVCFGAFMGQLDASVVAVAYRPIGETFHVGLASVQIVSLTYLIALGALLVPVGKVSDRLGRKRVYLYGFTLFTVASVGCAVAPSLAVLAVVRAAQGAGAAMLQANSVALVSTSAPSGRLRTALGMQASAQAVGLAVGPSLGGFVVQTFGWRWVFAMNVPVGVVAVIAGRFLLPRTRIDNADPDGFRATLRRRGVRRGLFGASAAYLLLFGPIVLVPAVLQERGTRPFLAGAVVAALPIGFAFGAMLADRLLPSSWGTALRGRAGLATAATGLGSLLALGIHPDSCAVGLALAGLGLGLFVPTNNAAVMTAVPARSAALGGGLVSTARAIGTAAGTALVAIALAREVSGRAALIALVAVTIAAAATLPARSARPGQHSRA
ncbi:MAG: hypothetical protein QOH14_2631 [Pseudonocardiales bacterium]|nr:hypothetical protein [Pseudonocardiales bacterium]